MKTVLLTACLIFVICQGYSCTIISYTKNGKAYAAGNEDDYANTLYPRIWFNPATNNRYGTVFLGLADLQAATMMNEYGLFVDFTMQVSIDPSTFDFKHPYPGDLWFDILGHCKTVDEAIKIIQRYDYGYGGQALLADATGKSVIINAAGKVFDDKGYQINTNFNILDVDKGKSDRRYNLANEMLAQKDDMSTDDLKMLLDRTHQEGDLLTIYSYIFDMKSGVIRLYYLHNYTSEYVIDIKKELKKGYRLENLTNFFPKTYAFETMVLKNPELEKEKILSEIRNNGLSVTVNHCLNRLDTLGDSVTAQHYANVMIDVSLQLIKDSWNAHMNGAMWEYWFGLPDGYRVVSFSDARLTAARHILDRLLARQQPDVKLNNFMTEIAAYLRLIDGDKTSAIKLYTLASRSANDCFPMSYQRATAMLSRLR